MLPDLEDDAKFCAHPTVTGEPHLRFYCGMPLITKDGYALGTICVMDFQPHEINRDQIEAVRHLSRQVMGQLELRRKLIELGKAHEQLGEAQQEAAAEKARSDELLLNFLPAKIADELKEKDHVEPRYFGSVTIMFTDFKGFTRLAESMEPRGLINDLDQYFSAFNDIIERHGLEKLRTIGDAYMCVGGLPEENATHTVDVCLAALEILSFMPA